MKKWPLIRDELCSGARHALLLLGVTLVTYLPIRFLPFCATFALLCVLPIVVHCLPKELQDREFDLHD